MRKPAAMVVAGVMSGTSADGVDVALVRVSPGRAAPKIEVLGHSEFPYPEAVRAAVLQAASGEMKTAELSRLNWKLGEVYAGCVEMACAAAEVEFVRPHLNRDKAAIEMGHPEVGSKPRLELVGMHGQTVFHEAPGATWQIGEAAVVRERLGVPVVSDFRPADMAAGGQGAPLVPMLDYCLFASKTKNRVLLNLGGIANMTVIPAGAGMEDVIAFDTGPGNMVIDAVMQREFGKAFDRGGKFGMLGLMLEPVLMELVEERYFELPPPKSCGREQFGAAFVERFSKMCAANGGDARDMVATAVALTATTVSAAYQHFCRERMQSGVTEMIVAGGGVRNEALMEALRLMLRWMNVKVMATDEVGLAAQAKEAVAFALLGWLSWHGLPGNVPSATGAKRAVVLGKVTG